MPLPRSIQSCRCVIVVCVIFLPFRNQLWLYVYTKSTHHGWTGTRHLVGPVVQCGGPFLNKQERSVVHVHVCTCIHVDIVVRVRSTFTPPAKLCSCSKATSPHRGANASERSEQLFRRPIRSHAQPTHERMNARTDLTGFALRSAAGLVLGEIDWRTNRPTDTDAMPTLCIYTMYYTSGRMNEGTQPSRSSQSGRQRSACV